MRKRFYDGGVALMLLLGLMGCVRINPINIDSDPNIEAQERREDKIDESNLEVFISEHPEFDDKTKQGLRDGTLTRREALDGRTNPSPVRK
jgi:hypothetical protein